MTETPRATAYVGLGSNVGAPQAQVTRALREIEGLPHTKLIRHSSLYETEPVGLRDQPGFINAVAIIETALSARALLDGLLDIEQRHGRVRTVKNGPRTLDLDILLYGDARIDEDGLTIPHPRMHERGFVLEPLLEIDADCEIPGLGRAAQYRQQALGQGVRKIGGAT